MMVDDLTYVRDLPLIPMLTWGSLKEPFVSQSPAGRQADRHLLWVAQAPKRRLLVSSPLSFSTFQAEESFPFLSVSLICFSIQKRL